MRAASIRRHDRVAFIPTEEETWISHFRRARADS
jgi:hypothetical protein